MDFDNIEDIFYLLQQACDTFNKRLKEGTLDEDSFAFMFIISRPDRTGSLKQNLLACGMMETLVKVLVSCAEEVPEMRKSLLAALASLSRETVFFPSPKAEA